MCPATRDLQARSQQQHVGADLASRITLAQLVELTGVPEHYLRHLAHAGALGEVIQITAFSGQCGPGSLTFDPDVIDTQNPTAGTTLLPAEWIARHRGDRVLIAEASVITGLTQSQVRSAVTNGELRSWITDGGTHRFDPDDLARFAAERNSRGRLTRHQAARHAGVTGHQLDYAVKSGALPIGGRTKGGHARFREKDVDRWIREHPA